MNLSQNLGIYDNLYEKILKETAKTRQDFVQGQGLPFDVAMTNVNVLAIFLENGSPHGQRQCESRPGFYQASIIFDPCSLNRDLLERTVVDQLELS